MLVCWPHKGRHPAALLRAAADGGTSDTVLLLLLGRGRSRPRGSSCSFPCAQCLLLTPNCVEGTVWLAARWRHTSARAVDATTCTRPAVQLLLVVLLLSCQAVELLLCIEVTDARRQLGRDASLVPTRWGFRPAGRQGFVVLLVARPAADKTAAAAARQGCRCCCRCS